MKPAKYGGVDKRWAKVTYTTRDAGDSVWVTAHLPPGFTMREFTYCFLWKTADELKMSHKDYLIYEQANISRELQLRIRK